MIPAQSPFGTHCGKSGHGTNKAERDNGIFHHTEEADEGDAEEEEEEEEEEEGRPPEGSANFFAEAARRRFCRIAWPGGMEPSWSGGEEDKVTSHSAVIHA